MSRAGIFIGVDRTATLQGLNDAAAGARRMYEWALAQGMAAESHAKLITDGEGQDVQPNVISKAIKELVEGPGVDQLILYFAGHGVNINRSEYWLLSDATSDTNAAVNVRGSVELARYCGIHHVVLISDACRTAPDGIAAGSMTGSNIFPNTDGGDRAKPVDQYFACLLGKTAAELQDPAIAAGNYSALYTGALLDALQGAVPDILELSEEAGDRARYVRPAPLQGYLQSEIPRRVKRLRLEKKVNQNPDAFIVAEIPPAPKRWISQIDAVTESPGLRDATPLVHRPPSLRSVAHTLVRLAAAGDQDTFSQHMEQAKAVPVAGADQLVGTAQLIAAAFGPDHFETHCGIKVRGARIVDFFAPRCAGELLGAGDILRITGVESLHGQRIDLFTASESVLHGVAPLSVLLQFEGNAGTVVPAVPLFITALTFDDGELVDVAFEPSANTARWREFQDKAPEVRALRAIAASASQSGRFRLEAEDAMKIAQKMQSAKRVDPSFAVYAAYAYHDLQTGDRISEMSRFLQNDIGATLFDLALLDRQLIGKSIKPDDQIVPFIPLLSQGWALLSAHRFRLHPALDGIERTMRNSLWTLFETGGLEMLRSAMATRGVR